MRMTHSQVSFIDANAEFEREFPMKANSGLGLEEYIYVDDSIIVVNKPANLQTAPGYVDPISLATTIRDKYNISRIDQMIVHRLDYATSGIVVYARDVDSLKDLHRQFRSSDDIFKQYSSIVDGVVENDGGQIKLSIGKDNVHGPPLQMIDKNGKQCDTTYFVEERGQYLTLLRLIPKTGRYLYQSRVFEYQ